MRASDTTGKAWRVATCASSSAGLALVVSLIFSGTRAEAKDESREAVTEVQSSTTRSVASVEARPADDKGPRVEAFELDRTEVTVADYGACVRAGRCKHLPTRTSRPRTNRVHSAIGNTPRGAYAIR